MSRPRSRQDVRYAGPDNFTGAPVPGYGAAECWLLEPVAMALALVAQDAAARGLSLVVWDAYRPQRASDHFLRWSQAPEEGEDAARLRGRFHPRIGRADLFARGFLSERSSHSRGAAVDLGLLDASGELLDFGAPFDFFDALSATDSQEISRSRASQPRAPARPDGGARLPQLRARILALWPPCWRGCAAPRLAHQLRQA